MAFSLRERVNDVFSVLMTATVLAISAIFFLSFTTPQPTSVSYGSPVAGALVDGSCSYATTGDNYFLRSGNSSAYVTWSAMLTSIGVIDINRTLVTSYPYTISTVCYDFSVSRDWTPRGSAQGTYRATLTAIPPEDLGLSECLMYNFTFKDVNYFVYNEASFTRLKNYVLSSRVTRFTNILPTFDDVEAAVLTNAQIVEGPPVNMNGNINSRIDLDAIFAKIHDEKVSCDYVPAYKPADPAFGLNVATVVVTALCLFAQVEFYFHKYFVGPKQSASQQVGFQ